MNLTAQTFEIEVKENYNTKNALAERKREIKAAQKAEAAEALAKVEGNDISNRGIVSTNFFLISRPNTNLFWISFAKTTVVGIGSHQPILMK